MSRKADDYTILWMNCHLFNSWQQFYTHKEGEDRYLHLFPFFNLRGFSGSCRDGFRLRDGLLPQRGGEGIQTHQCRDWETTPAGQARRKTGAEAAAAWYVPARAPLRPRVRFWRQILITKSQRAPYLLYLYLGKMKWIKFPFITATFPTSLKALYLTDPLTCMVLAFKHVGVMILIATNSTKNDSYPCFFLDSCTPQSK